MMIEKMIALIKEGDCGALTLGDCSYCKYDGEDDCSYRLLADVLLANGVVVREKGEWEVFEDCIYSPETGEDFFFPSTVEAWNRRAGDGNV